MSVTKALESTERLVLDIADLRGARVRLEDGTLTKVAPVVLPILGPPQTTVARLEQEQETAENCLIASEKSGSGDVKVGTGREGQKEYGSRCGANSEASETGEWEFVSPPAEDDDLGGVITPSESIEATREATQEPLKDQRCEVPDGESLDSSPNDLLDSIDRARDAFAALEADVFSDLRWHISQYLTPPDKQGRPGSGERALLRSLLGSGLGRLTYWELEETTPAMAYIDELWEVERLARPRLLERLKKWQDKRAKRDRRADELSATTVDFSGLFPSSLFVWVYLAAVFLGFRSMLYWVLGW